MGKEDATLSEKCRFVILHSDVSFVEQRRAFTLPPRGLTKVILATSVAESSITVSDITYIIDSGLSRLPRPLDANATVSATGDLATGWATQSSVEQRRGRAGRCRPGVCFRLFTRARLAKLPEQHPAALTHCPLHQLVLQVVMMDVDPADLLSRALDPPSKIGVQNAQMELERLGALGPGSKITALGHLLFRLPLSAPGFGTALAASCLVGLAEPMVSLIAALTARDTSSCCGNGQGSSLHWGKLATELQADIVAAVAALGAFEACGSDKETGGDECQWQLCGDAGLSHPAMQEMSLVRRELLEVLADVGLVGRHDCTDQVTTAERLRESWSVLSALLVFSLGWNLGRTSGTDNASDQFWVCLSNTAAPDLSGGGTPKDKPAAEGQESSDGKKKVALRKVRVGKNSVLALRRRSPESGPQVMKPEPVGKIFVFGAMTVPNWGIPLCLHTLIVPPLPAALFCASVKLRLPPPPLDAPLLTKSVESLELNGWLRIRGDPSHAALIVDLRRAHARLLEEVVSRCFSRSQKQTLARQFNMGLRHDARTGDGAHGAALRTWCGLLYDLAVDGQEPSKAGSFPTEVD